MRQERMHHRNQGRSQRQFGGMGRGGYQQHWEDENRSGRGRQAREDWNNWDDDDEDENFHEGQFEGRFSDYDEDRGDFSNENYNDYNQGRDYSQGWPSGDYGRVRHYYNQRRPYYDEDERSFSDWNERNQNRHYQNRSQDQERDEYGRFQSPHRSQRQRSGSNQAKRSRSRTPRKR